MPGRNSFDPNRVLTPLLTRSPDFGHVREQLEQVAYHRSYTRSTVVRFRRRSRDICYAFLNDFDEDIRDQIFERAIDFLEDIRWFRSGNAAETVVAICGPIVAALHDARLENARSSTAVPTSSRYIEQVKTLLPANARIGRVGCIVIAGSDEGVDIGVGITAARIADHDFFQTAVARHVDLPTTRVCQFGDSRILLVGAYSGAQDLVASAILGPLPPNPENWVVIVHDVPRACVVSTKSCLIFDHSFLLAAAVAVRAARAGTAYHLVAAGGALSPDGEARTYDDSLDGHSVVRRKADVASREGYRHYFYAVDHPSGVVRASGTSAILVRDADSVISSLVSQDARVTRLRWASIAAFVSVILALAVWRSYERYWAEPQRQVESLVRSIYLRCANATGIGAASCVSEIRTHLTGQTGSVDTRLWLLGVALRARSPQHMVQYDAGTRLIELQTTTRNGWGILTVRPHADGPLDTILLAGRGKLMTYDVTSLVKPQGSRLQIAPYVEMPSDPISLFAYRKYQTNISSIRVDLHDSNRWGVGWVQQNRGSIDVPLSYGNTNLLACTHHLSCLYTTPQLHGPDVIHVSVDDVLSGSSLPNGTVQDVFENVAIMSTSSAEAPDSGHLWRKGAWAFWFTNTESQCRLISTERAVCLKSTASVIELMQLVDDGSVRTLDSRSIAPNVRSIEIDLANPDTPRIHLFQEMADRTIVSRLHYREHRLAVTKAGLSDLEDDVTDNLRTGSCQNMKSVGARTVCESGILLSRKTDEGLDVNEGLGVGLSEAESLLVGDHQATLVYEDPLATKWDDTIAPSYPSTGVGCNGEVTWGWTSDKHLAAYSVDQASCRTLNSGDRLFCRGCRNSGNRYENISVSGDGRHALFVDGARVFLATRNDPHIVIETTASVPAVTLASTSWNQDGVDLLVQTTTAHEGLSTALLRIGFGRPRSPTHINVTSASRTELPITLWQGTVLGVESTGRGLRPKVWSLGKETRSPPPPMDTCTPESEVRFDALPRIAVASANERAFVFGVETCGWLWSARDHTWQQVRLPSISNYQRSLEIENLRAMDGCSGCTTAWHLGPRVALSDDGDVFALKMDRTQLYHLQHDDNFLRIPPITLEPELFQLPDGNEIVLTGSTYEAIGSSGAFAVRLPSKDVVAFKEWLNAPAHITPPIRRKVAESANSMTTSNGEHSK